MPYENRRRDDPSVSPRGRRDSGAVRRPTTPGLLRFARNDDRGSPRLRRRPLVRLYACGKLDRFPMRRAQIGALPLLLALIEFRASDGAVFRKHPLERREHCAVISFAVVGRGVERRNLRPERLSPARGRNQAALDEEIGDSERFSMPRLAERRLSLLGLETACAGG